jgi:hypothetical protein
MLLGIQAVTAGFGEWEVELLALGLVRARGRHTVPCGVIQVDW